MTVPMISHPFDLKATGKGGYIFGIISLTIFMVLSVIGFGFFKGYFQPFAELSTLPLDLFCAAFSFMFLFAGIASFYRYRRYRVDPLKQTIQLVKGGIFGSRYAEVIRFDELKHILVAREDRGGHDNKTIYFPVYIHLKSDDMKQVFLSDRYLPARACGERLAKVTTVEFHDESQPGKTQVRKPEELDETVREWLGKEFYHRQPPKAPTLMHAKIQPSFEMLTILIPRFDVARLGPMKKALWILLVLFGGCAAAAFYFESYMFSLFGAIVFGVMLYGVLHSQTITLTRDILTVRSGIFFLKRTKQIPLSELEELCLLNSTGSESNDSDKLLQDKQITRSIHTALQAFVALGSAIVARSDRESITFGRILSNAELDHILYKMERWIRS